MPNTNQQYLYRSPFNFLDPYTKEDEKIFFGRDDEIDDVFLLFEKTNLVVIYGPSGSGKSSVAQCGLVNRFFDWQPIEIRRNLNIIDSFFEAIEIKTNAENEPTQGLFPAEDCQKLRTIYDKLTISATDDNYDSNDDEDLTELREIIEILYMGLSVTPFYIFDQFEELFIENRDTAEIENFSLLLSLITKRVSYSNVVLCIQTEFFSNLVKLEGYNPNILNYKCEIKDPNEENIRKIIRGTFEKFNINQVKDGSTDKISMEDKEERIDEIIKRLKKVGSHLPFVQIYLDKLYVLDFEDTYEKEKDLLKTPKEINPNKYPLEFKVDEIEKYGQIDEILENYIDKVNTAVIAAHNKIGHKGYEHSIAKFLKHFITENDTRRAIEVELRPRKTDPDDLYYVILGDVKNEIIRSIWGTDRSDVDESLDDIIDELLKARILKYRNGLLEFSHNFLVRVVKKISIDKDIVEYYKRQFNSAYDTYVISNESKNELLSSGQVRNLKGRIDEVLGRTKEESNDKIKKNGENDKKEEFWKKSKNWALWRKVSLIGSYILMGAAFIIGIAIWAYQNEINEREKALEKLARAETDSIKVVINNRITDAADVGINNITKSYRTIGNFPSFLNENKVHVSKNDFSLGSKMYHNLLQNYVAEPFYKKKISLFSEGKREHILSTKSRKLNDSVYVLFALTPDSLYATKILLYTNEHSEKWTEISGSTNQITAYEPYVDKEGKIRVLYSNNEGLHDISWKPEDNGNNLFKDDIGYRNLKDIDLSKNIDATSGVGYFVALNWGSNSIFRIKKSNGDYEIRNFKIPKPAGRITRIIALKTLDKKNNVISYLSSTGDSNIIYRHKVDQWYEPSNDTIILKKNIQLRESVLNSFKLDTDEELILFEDDRKVYSIPFAEFSDTTRTKPIITTKIISFHHSKINSIDNSGKYTILGSNDKTASLFYDREAYEGDEILTKTFKGHTDAIKNVSFLGKNHVLTSSEDGTINLWDISAPENASISLYPERQSIRIKYNKATKKLYTGFLKFPGRDSSLLELAEKPNNASFQVKRLMKSSKYDSNSFDFYKDEVYIGQRSGNMISVFNKNQKKTKEFALPQKRSGSLIFDLKIRASSMAVITNEGIYYFANLENLDSIEFEEIENNNLNLNSVDIHPTKKLLVATSNDKKIYYWNIEREEFLVLPNGHVDIVKDARFSVDGNYMVSVSWDNTAIVWKVTNDNTLERKAIIDSHNNDIVTVTTALREDGHLIIATGSSDKTVQLHGLSDSQLYRIPSIIRHDNAIRSVTFGENSNIIYSADSKGNIKKWNIATFATTINDRTAK